MKNKKIAFLTTIFPIKKKYIYEFFDSLKNQTYTNFDLIIVNDNYKNFAEIKLKYAPYLNIIEIKGDETPAKNREKGINYCIDKGYEILIFGDIDDYFGSNRVEKSIEMLKNYDITINDVTLFDDKKGIYEEKYFSNRIKNNSIIDFEFIKDKNIFGFTNTAINLYKVENVVFNKDMKIVDWYFFKKLLKKGLKAIFINENVTFYRQYENNLIGLKKKNGKYYLWGEK
jgi:glycosyltransferase involved in cell wall biosynthesis